MRFSVETQKCLDKESNQNWYCAEIECLQDGLRYELQDAVVPLGIRQFQVLVEKCQEVEDMRNKRMNRQGGSSAGGPSRTNDRGSTQNSGRQGSRPYNRPQHS